MTKEECKIGMKVVRDNKLHTNYTDGRAGKILDIAEKIQVHWLNEKDGRIIDIRTWVTADKLKLQQ